MELVFRSLSCSSMLLINPSSFHVAAILIIFLKRNYLSNLSNRHNVSRASVKPSTLLESNLTSYIFNVIQSPSLFSLLCPSLNVLGYTRHTEEKGYLLKKRSGEWISLFIRYSELPHDYDASSFLCGCLGALEREKKQETPAGLTNKGNTSRRE